MVAGQRGWSKEEALEGRGEAQKLRGEVGKAVLARVRAEEVRGAGSMVEWFGDGHGKAFRPVGGISRQTDASMSIHGSRAFSPRCVWSKNGVEAVCPRWWSVAR